MCIYAKYIFRDILYTKNDFGKVNRDDIECQYYRSSCTVSYRKYCIFHFDSTNKSIDYSLTEAKQIFNEIQGMRIVRYYECCRIAAIDRALDLQEK